MGEDYLEQEKRSYRKSAQQPSQVLFTLPEMRLLKYALRTFEASLLRAKEPHPHHSMAKEIVEQLKSKLDDMLQMEDWEKETPFDYNEIYILYASLQMYLIDLTFSQQEHLLPECMLLCKQFGRMVEELNAMKLV